MSARRIGCLALLSLVWGSGACSKEDRPPAGLSAEEPEAGGAPSVPFEPADGDAGTSGDAGASGSSQSVGGASQMDPEGPVDLPELDEVPTEGCNAIEVSGSTILEPEPLGVVFDQAGVVGDGRFAFDSASLAFLTFQEDGSGSTALRTRTLAALTGSGTHLLGLELDAEQALQLSTFDARNRDLAPPIQLDGPGTSSHALLSEADQHVAVWRLNDELKGALIADGDDAPKSFSLGRRACSTLNCKPLLRRSRQHFTLLWTRESREGRSELDFALISSDASIIAVSRVIDTSAAIALVDVAPLTDDGYAVLLRDADAGAGHGPIIVKLDAFGRAAARGSRFLGAGEPWGLVLSGVTLGLVAEAEHGQAAFRALDLEGVPLAEWLCLDDSGLDTAFVPRAALIADQNGFGAVVRHTDGSSVYLRPLSTD